MPVAKPASETLVNGAHALAPNYAAWILRGVDPEKDSLHLGTVSAPIAGSGATVSAGPFGDPAWDFGGAAGLRPIANLPLPSPTVGQDQTIIARIFTRTISGFDTIYANNSTGLYLEGGKPRLYSQTAANTALSTSTWYTVGVTVNTNNSTKYYIDGVLDRTVANGGIGLPSGAGVGIGHDNAGDFFDGIIDYLFIWQDFAMPDASHLSIHNDPFQVFAAAASALPNFIHHYKQQGIM